MPCKDCCEKRGSPGWENNCHSATYEDSDVTSIPTGRIGSVSTANECCKKCLDDKNCIQWSFGNNPVGNPQILVNSCFLFYNNLIPGICNMPSRLLADQTEVLFDCGVIRCENEGCFSH
ncbi:4611_t:CDS:1 [Dentiscutata erythropus]|uniref:4611_t:CDS:1 n=1 Tax=Dentiscutata erythropus TaxID=1348616 RepID=A0A9N9DTN9_9GLOM|nr:4611_t:CDS:1 [Dentiscutata erythropus]